jgi:hypothetical protein
MSETPHPSLPPTPFVLRSGLAVGRGAIKVEFQYPKPTLPARRRQAGALLGECRRSGRSSKVGITNRGEFVEGGSFGGLGPIVNRLNLGSDATPHAMNQPSATSHAGLSFDRFMLWKTIENQHRASVCLAAICDYFREPRYFLHVET